MRSCEGLVGQVCYPVTGLIVKRRDKAALFTVKGVTDGEPRLTPVEMRWDVWGLQPIPLIILAKEPIKKILLSHVGKASRLIMMTATLKTFPLAKTKIRYRGCMGNGLPQLLVQGGGIQTLVMQRGDGKTTVVVR